MPISLHAADESSGSPAGEVFKLRARASDIDSRVKSYPKIQFVVSGAKGRQPQPGLTHHSDRGGQYAGNEYPSILRCAGALQSMSRAGDCYDNAFMESCFGTIKTELKMTDYENSRQARKEIAQYIRYYDFER